MTSRSQLLSYQGVFSNMFQMVDRYGRWALKPEGLIPKGAYNRNIFSICCLHVDEPITGGHISGGEGGGGEGHNWDFTVFPRNFH